MTTNGMCQVKEATFKMISFIWYFGKSSATGTNRLVTARGGHAGRRWI